eukprot:TRINITY_DN775916_c0_g1_i1.p1 TRINITY_DN775916_c0_g1~~TRINITY_DN775916_c0_g1_i1.p1  ORF type:complete len:334 (-),score=79.99 TRINITY_DN775916_c0_g1_i1:155-1156(-)
MDTLSLEGFVPKDEYDSLVACGISNVSQLLHAHDLELMGGLGCDLSYAREVKYDISSRVAPKPRTALDEYDEKMKFGSKVSTSIDDLDRYLSGGISFGGITEFVGPAGVGKTNFCTLIAAATVCRTENQGVIYIDTEMSFATERLMAIFMNRFNITEGECARRRFLQRIGVSQSILDLESFERFLENVEEAMKIQNAKVLIIDSIAKIFKTGFNAENMNERQQKITTCVQKLKKLAEDNAIAVLITNQIWSESESGLIPALGLYWEHCVNTRLELNRIPKRDKVKRGSLTIRKSPLVAMKRFVFEINDQGIMLTDEEFEPIDKSADDPGLYAS